MANSHLFVSDVEAQNMPGNGPANIAATREQDTHNVDVWIGGFVYAAINIQAREEMPHRDDALRHRREAD